MLANALAWGFALVISCILGFSLVNLVFARMRPGRAPAVSFFLLVLAGLAVLEALCGALLFFVPLSPAAALAVAAISAGLAFWQRRDLGAYLGEKLAAARRLHPLVIAAAVTVFAVVLIKASQASQNYDTGLYHAQAIRWFETYRLVPGLGNLHDRLAFNSSWLQISALLSFSFLGIGSLHALDGFILLVAAGYALVRADRLLTGELTLANAAALAVPFLLRRIFSLELSSPGTDLPAAMLVWVIFLAALERFECRRAGKADAEFWTVWVVALFALTVKLSALPVLIVPAILWLSLAGRFKPGLLARGALAGLILLAPWLATNAVLSGYLVYPLPQLDIIHPAWQIPAGVARESAYGILSWARTANPDWAVVSKMGLAQWVPIWYGKLEPLDRQVIWGAVLAGLMLLGWVALQAWRNPRRLAIFRQIHWLYWIALAGVAYWFLSAPAIRFGMAFLGIWIILCAAPWIASLLGAVRGGQKAALFAVLVVFILYQGVGLYRAAGPAELISEALRPAPYPAVATGAHALGGFTVYTPNSGNQCWYGSFPCAPGVNPKLVFRGPSLQDGFQVAP